MPVDLGILQANGTVLPVGATNGIPVTIVAGGGGGTAAADGATFTEGTSAVTPVGGEYNDAFGNAVAGKVAAFRSSLGRGLHVNLRNNAGAEIAPALDATLTTMSGKLPAALVGGRLDVNVGASANLTIGTLPSIPTGTNVIGAVTQSGTWNATINTALPVGTNTIGAVTGPAAAALALDSSLTTISGKLPAALVGGRLDVNVGAALPTGANTIGAVTQASGPWTTQGAAATGAAVSGNPVQMGGKDLSGNAQPMRMQTDGTPIVGGIGTVISTTLTRPANTTTYTAGDEMTDTGTTIRTITGAARFSGGSGVIMGVGMSCSSNGATLPSLELWIFDTTSTPQTDNAAFAPADGEVDTCIAIIPLNATYIGTTGATGNFWMDTGQISVPFICSGSANLFLRVVVRNGYTPGANSDTQKFRFRILQD